MIDPVAHQAGIRPGKTAVVGLADGERLSYAVLDRRVADTAARLHTALGEPRGARVAVLGRNSIEQLVICFAAERIGAILVPLNWRLARPELAQLLADSMSALLCCDDEFLADGRAASEDLPVRCLGFGNLADSDVDVPEARAAMPGGADDAAILLYTSGTTGRPKGAIVTRANALYASLNFAFVGEIGPATVSLLDAPLFHTIGLVAVARTTLMTGGMLLVSDRFVPGRTLERLGDPALGVTHYFGVPQMAAAIAAEPGFPTTDITRLHAIFLGGAPLSEGLIATYLERGVALVNGYGMSEAGTVMHMPIDAEAVRAHPGAIGHPAPLIEVRIAQPDGTDVAAGETGEIWLRGPSVTPGYWNAPAESAATFTDGWLRTGDLARREAGGVHHLVDRLKDMYVTGGENVFPAEVEAVLLAHPAVADAAVIGVPDARWGETGLAYVVARDGAGIDPEALVDHCRARLARFKCPARFVAIDTIPRTASGKIMKPVLRARAADPR